jgi:ferredoxin
MAHYHQESFSAPVVEEVPAPFSGDGEPDDQAEALPVRFAVSGIEGQCQPGQTVLQTARASGVRISAACEFGLCGTCKVKKLSGEVEMSHNGGILDDEIADGFILACCSKPLTPLEIEA